MCGWRQYKQGCPLTLTRNGYMEWKWKGWRFFHALFQASTFSGGGEPTKEKRARARNLSGSTKLGKVPKVSAFPAPAPSWLLPCLCLHRRGRTAAAMAVLCVSMHLCDLKSMKTSIFFLGSADRGTIISKRLLIVESSTARLNPTFHHFCLVFPPLISSEWPASKGKERISFALHGIYSATLLDRFDLLITTTTFTH